MMILLDRDGVINYDSEHYIKSEEEWIEIPGSIKAIADLKNAGHTVVVVTNQSGIARGLYTHEILAGIHQKMHGLLANYGAKLDGVYYCPHHPDEHCHCRKPEVGLLEQVAEDYQANLAEAIMVGDSWRDLQAALAVGARPILVRTGNGEITLNKYPKNLANIAVFPDLAAVVNTVLSEKA